MANELKKLRGRYASVESIVKRGYQPSISDFTLQQWLEMVERHEGRCAYCRQDAELGIDHITPLCGGGDHSEYNILPSCYACNVRKNRKPADDFLAEQYVPDRTDAPRPDNSTVDIVKVRRLGNSVIITLPSHLIPTTDIQIGDLVMLQVLNPTEILIQRQERPKWQHPAPSKIG